VGKGKQVNIVKEEGINCLGRRASLFTYRVKRGLYEERRVLIHDKSCYKEGKRDYGGTLLLY